MGLFLFKQKYIDIFETELVCLQDQTSANLDNYYKKFCRQT